MSQLICQSSTTTRKRLSCSTSRPLLRERDFVELVASPYATTDDLLDKPRVSEYFSKLFNEEHHLEFIDSLNEDPKLTDLFPQFSPPLRTKTNLVLDMKREDKFERQRVRFNKDVLMALNAKPALFTTSRIETTVISACRRRLEYRREYITKSCVLPENSWKHPTIVVDRVLDAVYTNRRQSEATITFEVNGDLISRVSVLKNNQLTMCQILETGFCKEIVIPLRAEERVDIIQILIDSVTGVFRITVNDVEKQVFPNAPHTIKSFLDLDQEVPTSHAVVQTIGCKFDKMVVMKENGDLVELLEICSDDVIATKAKGTTPKTDRIRVSWRGVQEDVILAVTLDNQLYFYQILYPALHTLMMIQKIAIEQTNEEKILKMSYFSSFVFHIKRRDKNENQELVFCDTDYTATTYGKHLRVVVPIDHPRRLYRLDSGSDREFQILVKT